MTKEMASLRNLLHPLKQSLAAITYSTSFSSLPRKFLYAKYGLFTSLTKGSGTVIRSRFSEIQCNLSTHVVYFRKRCSSGSNKVRIGSGIIAACAVVGSISFWARVSYAMGEFDVLGHDDSVSCSSSDEKDDPNVVWRFARKLWLPVFFFLQLLTMMSHSDYPLAMIAFKAILFLLSTNPSPFSVYVSVNELCRLFMHREPHLYHSKSLYAQKVEVRDYKLLCLAKVEVRDQKFTLVGILGGWWALPSSSIREGSFSLLRSKQHQYTRSMGH